MNTAKSYLKRAILLASQHSMEGDHGPFGAVIVKDGKVIAEGWNQVVHCKDPSAHAEIEAIRKACAILDTHSLEGCILYSSCEPCPMCLGAAIWARLDKIVFAETREGAAKAGFDDAMIYNAITSQDYSGVIKSEYYPMSEATALFDDWNNNLNKKIY